jgi:hypothetical protein
MFKMSHAALIALSGVIWLAVGAALLPLGLNFLVASILKDNLATLSHPLINLLSPLVGGVDIAVLSLIALGLFIGHFKSRTIFAKTVNKSVERIRSLPNPAPLSRLYNKKYYLLLGSMVFVGFVVRLAPLDVRGFIDVAIGSALINGAIAYFRAAIQVFRQNRTAA